MEINILTDMKKFNILITLMTTTLVGCQGTLESNMGETPSSEDFTASMEVFKNITRTTLNDNMDIVWSKNDQLAIFQGSTIADRYQVTDDSAGKSNGLFSIINESEGGIGDDFIAGNEISTNIAIYPYSESLSCTKANIKGADSQTQVEAYLIDGVILPLEQIYSSYSFGENSFPMVAVTESISDHKLKFKNVMGGIKLQLKGTQKVTSIGLEGENNEKLSGLASITAYLNDLVPVITMKSESYSSVTLNCGNGIQLNENKATEFIITIPPMLFSKGFTVSVTDSEGKTYTIKTDKANTIMRSSILVMPVVKLSDTGGSVEDDIAVPVVLVKLSKTSLKLAPNYTYNLNAEVIPVGATNKQVAWSSDDVSVAVVSQNGSVTAISDGKVNIIATADGVTSICKVSVISPAKAIVDYIDEYGVNHGKGIPLGRFVWAPVNCGYHIDEYPHGKHYQWGRKYGQGLGSYYDSYEPEILTGPISFDVGQQKGLSNYFINGSAEWCSTDGSEWWNSNTESEPRKTEYDPCPSGWRVPTHSELETLNFEGADVKWNGISFCDASYDMQVSDKTLFLPFEGGRNGGEGNIVNVWYCGYYWSSSCYNAYSSRAYHLYFDCEGNVNMNNEFGYAMGFSIRCIQE